MNIVPITQYTNGWKSNKSPTTYLRQVMSLGISQTRLRSLFRDHLIELDFLLEEDWRAFFNDRRASMDDFLSRRILEVANCAQFDSEPLSLRG